MDPNETLQKFMDALISGDHGATVEAHGDLTAWLARGGFEPEWRNRRNLFEAFDPETGLVDVAAV